MKKKVKHFIDDMTVPLPDPKVTDISSYDRRKLSAALLDQVLADVEAGQVYTVKQLASMLHCSPNKARELAKKEPGTFPLGSDYRVPRCVFRNLVSKLAAA
jgi:hypothetical protein